MRKSYYMMCDVSVDYKDSGHAVYFSVWENSDILGWVTGWKRKNENVRLFRFATKKAWEDSRRMWVDAIAL